MWPTSCYVYTLVQVRFWPEAIYSISIHVQIISHELNSSHFPTFEIFVNNLVPGSHSTPITPKNVKIRLSQNSIRFVWVTRFHETNPTVSLFCHSRSRKFQGFRLVLFWQFTFLPFFLEKFNFSWVLHIRFQI